MVLDQLIIQHPRLGYGRNRRVGIASMTESVIHLRSKIVLPVKTSRHVIYVKEEAEEWAITSENNFRF